MAEIETAVYAVSDEQRTELTKRFTYHAPVEDQPVRYEMLRTQARVLGLLIAQLTPASREQSLAWTALEECVMWANAAIARREES
jgi:hypothetical protein